MTFKQIADYCRTAISRYRPKREQEPVGYDPRWDGMTVKDLYFVINCLLLPHQRFSSYEDLVHKINGTGKRTATDDQKAAATAVLRHRAGQMYDLTEALSGMHRKYMVEVAENVRLERVLSSWGWLAMRNFWWTAALVAVTAWVGMVGRPALMIIAKDVRYDAIVDRMMTTSETTARTIAENKVLRQYLDDARAENQELGDLLRGYVGE